MTTWVKNGIIFLIGAGVGSAVGYLVGTKRAEKKAEKELQELEEYYGSSEKYKRTDEEASDTGTKKESEDSEGRADKETVRELRKEEKKPNTHKTDYTKYYKKKETKEGDLPYDNGMSGGDFDGDDIKDETRENPGVEINEEADEYHQQYKERPPRIISVEKLGELPSSIEEECLYYYPEGDYITDEDDNVIEDYRRILGDCLQKYHFDTSNEETIWVQNFELDTVYEVTKMDEN